MYQIISHYFTAGIITKNNLVVDAAPIVKYMVGWDLAKVNKYCLNKKFKIYNYGSENTIR